MFSNLVKFIVDQMYIYVPALFKGLEDWLIDSSEPVNRLIDASLDKIIH